MDSSIFLSDTAVHRSQKNILTLFCSLPDHKRINDRFTYCTLWSLASSSLSLSLSLSLSHTHTHTHTYIHTHTLFSQLQYTYFFICESYFDIKGFIKLSAVPGEMESLVVSFVYKGFYIYIYIYIYMYIKPILSRIFLICMYSPSTRYSLFSFSDLVLLLNLCCN